MRIVLLSIQILLISSMAAGLLSACNGTNIDEVTETSCSQADGLWTITEVTCNGVAQEITPVTYLFDSESSAVVETTGRVDCATQFNWNVEIGEQTAIFSMTGNGSLSCTQSGLDANNCSSDVNTCVAGIDLTGIKNEFPTCVITNTGMSLVRTVSVINSPDGRSFCADGQSEIVTLSQGDYTPPIPEPEPGQLIAFINVEGANPTDFGTHPVGSRIEQTLTLSNTGNADATAVSWTGLDAPFRDIGDENPNLGGTCGDILPQGESCTIILEFFPQAAAYFQDDLRITYANGEQTVVINQGLAATASQNLALLNISGGPFYNFGAINNGDTLSNTFTVTNSGAATATAMAESGIAAPYNYVDGAYPGTGGDCGAMLLAGETCTLVIEFAPVADGTYQDSIDLDYNDGVNLQTTNRTVFGQGVTP